MIGAGLSPATPREGPEGQAVGQDFARARNQVVTDYLTRPACRSRSISLASTWSASAARPASAIRARLRPRFRRRSTTRASGRRGRAFGQPQFRRPRQPRRAGQLSRLAAAGRRLCPRRYDGNRSRHRAARPRQEGQAGLLQISGRRTRKSPSYVASRDRARCSRSAMPMCSTATQLAKVKTPTGQTYTWDIGSTYVQNPPFFEG